MTDFLALTGAASSHEFMARSNMEDWGTPVEYARGITTAHDGDDRLGTATIPGAHPRLGGGGTRSHVRTLTPLTRAGVPPK